MLPALLPQTVYILTLDYIHINIISFLWFNLKPVYHRKGIIQDILSSGKL
jgi:hypothetical protein